MNEILLWDKNGCPAYAPEGGVAEFCKAHEHREFQLERTPVVLGASKAKTRARFVANRVASLRRRYKRKHERTVADAMLGGEAQADAVAAADEKWGAEPPTPEAVEAELVEDGDIPESMREEA